MSKIKSISIFVIINLAAGGLNYLFQLVAARNLSSMDFANFNSWFAYVSLFTIGAGILQNIANFHSIKYSSIKMQSYLFGFIALISIGLVWMIPSGQNAMFMILFISLAMINGWMTGQNQIRLFFATMASAGFLAALAKLLLAINPGVSANVDIYIKFVTLAFVPSILLLVFAIIRSKPSDTVEVRPATLQLIYASLAMSIAIGLVPQIDIVILTNTLPSSVFQEFVRASIFYKMIFFLFLMFAQWLLPQQIRIGSKGKMSALYTVKPIVLGFIFSGGLAVISPLVSTYLMKWDVSPEMFLVFMSCINMSLLTWIYLVIQDLCAKQKAQYGLVANFALIVLGGVQLLLRLDVYSYLLLNFVGMIFVVGALTYFLRVKKTNL